MPQADVAIVGTSLVAAGHLRSTRPGGSWAAVDPRRDSDSINEE